MHFVQRKGALCVTFSSVLSIMMVTKPERNGKT